MSDTWGIPIPVQQTIMQPDVFNFPTQNKGMAKDFNFATELFKFLPKFVCLAYQGKRYATQDEIEGKNGQRAYNEGSWQASQEWEDAFNEFGITDSLAATVYGSAYNASAANGNYKPKTNQESANWYLANSNATTTWTWRTDWVSGFNHFNVGLTDGDYFWGEKLGKDITNADFVAEAGEWNHLTTKKPWQGLASLTAGNGPRPKDHTLDADVDHAVYVDQFLGAINKNWGDMNGVVGTDLSYYQWVMNATQGKTSWKNLTSEQATLMMA
jgi:hypothetical protein